MPKEDWNREVGCLMETLDDPLAFASDEHLENGELLDLGALLTATDLWEVSSGLAGELCGSAERQAQRRMVLHAVARAAGIDVRKVVTQARCHRRSVLSGDSIAPMGLFDIPRVDAKPDFDKPAIGSDKVPLLEEVILRDGEFFGLNAAEILYSLRNDAAYQPAIERLLSNGAGVALFYAAALAASLPEKQCQGLFLRRLTSGTLSRGCCHLYPRLTPPFGVEHDEAVYRGLDGSDPQVAVAAGKVAGQLAETPELMHRLRACFDEWKTKEVPYPNKGGTVPDSPRDELAKVLVRAYPTDYALLIAMAQDPRPDVRKVAEKPLTAALMVSEIVRAEIIQKTAAGDIDGMFLRSAISAGAFGQADALKVVPLLRSDSAKVRFAALPVLNSKYLPVEHVRSEALRLLSDPEIDIREGAHKALSTLLD